MNAGVNVLRSQLQHSCGQSLQNLTVTELKDIKWNTKQTVFNALLEQSPSLVSQFDEITSLLSERGDTTRKLASAPREERKDHEMKFRSRYVGVLASALEYLRWPPALEPFSDIHTDLFNDNDVVRSAMMYMCKVGISRQMDNNKSLSPRGLAVANSRPSSSTASRSSSARRPFSASSSSSHGSSSAHRGTSSRTPTRNGDDTNEDAKKRVQAVNVSPGTPLDSSGDDMNHAFTRLDFASDRAMEMPDLDMGEPGDNLIEIQPEQPHKSSLDDVFNSNNETTKLRRALEISQHQNEMLSQRLKQMMDATLARETAERRVGSLIRDLRAAVEEIAAAAAPLASATPAPMPTPSSGSIPMPPARKPGSSQSRSPPHPQAFSGSSASTTVTEAEEEAYREEMEREAREGGVSKESPGTLVASTGHVRASRAVGAAKSAASGRPSLGLGGSAVGPATASSIALTGVSWLKLRQRLGALQEAWDSAAKDCRAACGQSSAVHIHSAVFLQSTGSRRIEQGRLRNSPTDVYLGEVLGVNTGRGRGGAFSQSTRALEGALGDAPAVGLDLGRVHLLQRDLVAFADEASKHSILEDRCDSDGGQTDGSGGLNGSAEMQIRATDLALHLACLAPVAPLSADSPLQSCMTGLAALEEVLFLTHGGRGGSSSFGKTMAKALPPKLQRAMERARAEQMALGRALLQNRQILRGFPSATRQAAALLRKSGVRARGVLVHASDQLKRQAEAATRVCEALHCADEAPTKGQTSRPLESLSRGSMGREVAELVNSLRMYMPVLADLPAQLTALRRALGSESETDISQLATLEQALGSAAQRCSDLLSQPVNLSFLVSSSVPEETSGDDKTATAIRGSVNSAAVRQGSTNEAVDTANDGRKTSDSTSNSSKKAPRKKPMWSMD